jgi:hypothetical protein
MPSHPPRELDLYARETVRALACMRPVAFHLKAVLVAPPTMPAAHADAVRYEATLTRWRGAHPFRVHTVTTSVAPELAGSFHNLVHYLLTKALQAPPVKPPRDDHYGSFPAPCSLAQTSPQP